jgi:hypothetical protein
MKYKFLLLGMMITIVLLVSGVSGCVNSLVSLNNSSGTTSTSTGPLFMAIRDNATTITINYLDPNGATSVQGLYVQSPSIGSPTLINSTTNVSSNQDITVTDPNLAGNIHLVLTSAVNGKTQVVLDDYLDAQ